MATPKANEQTHDDSAAKPQGVCGIIMPISPIDPEYTAEHWRRVQRILERAVNRSGLRPQLVWENPEVDVIQSRILQNLYENDVVICDVSGLNPNVMLELGMRLSTKRPTIIVGDKERKPPFDINIIDHTFYQKDLEFNAIDAFIDKLSKRIIDVYKAHIDNKYKSFVENFQFETVTPATVQVSADEVLAETVAKLSIAIGRVERMVNDNSDSGSKRRFTKLAHFSVNLSEIATSLLVTELNMMPGIAVNGINRNNFDNITLSIEITASSEKRMYQLQQEVELIIDKHESDANPF